MEESSQNENIMNNNDELYLNDVVMEKKKMEEEFEIQSSLQTKKNINANEGKKKGKFEKLHFQRKKLKHDNRNVLCWSFYCVNDNKPVNVKCFQLMRCIPCYANPILITNAKTQARKCLILYNSANGITTLK
jgi:hypothetical protein